MGGVIVKGEQVIEKGLDAALQEALHVVLGTPLFFSFLVDKEIAPGVERLFSKEQEKKYETLGKLFTLGTDTAIFPGTEKRLFREFLLRAQMYIKTPNRYDTSHSYKTFTALTRENYYGRSLPEGQKMNELFVNKEEAEISVRNWLKQSPGLIIKESDPEIVKKEKQLIIDQIPYCTKVGDIFFTRSKTIEDQGTNFLLPLFAQWFVDQAFKSGSDNTASTPLNDMTRLEFVKQWGPNRVDLSNLYGDTEQRTWALRLKKDGKLKFQKVIIDGFECHFPPKLSFKKTDLCSEDEVCQDDIKMVIPTSVSKEFAEQNFFAMGHPRFNLHFGLPLIETIWLREHNRLCDLFKKNNPDWSDERLFQTARMTVIVTCIHIVVNDYIQHISGLEKKIPFSPEAVWDTEFQYNNRAHIEFNWLYRWHSMIPETVSFLDGHETKYSDLQWQPQHVKSLGIKKIVEGAVGTPMSRLGLKNTPWFLKNMEISTLMHSRVLKIQSYNNYREYWGCKRYSKFSEITTDIELQKELEGIYGSVDNIDWYVGLMAEDHLPGSMVGELMRTMLETYAFAALYSNPLMSKENFNEETFTKEGFESIKSSRIYTLVNRNLHENGCKDLLNQQNDPKFDGFKVIKKIVKDEKKQKDAPYKKTQLDIARRQAAIEKERQNWPVWDKSLPVRVDENSLGIKYLLALSVDKHHNVLIKRQLLEVFKQISVSVHTKSFMSTFKTQMEIILSILSKDSVSLSNSEVKRLIDAIDTVHSPSPRDNLLDSTYGAIARYFGKNDSWSIFKAFNWNRDETFGELMLNGLDPTQITQLTEKHLTQQFEKFVLTAGTYFEKKYKKKFVNEVRAGKFYVIDNYETMNLVVTNPVNTARPRALFYFDETTLKLMPIGIQLNVRTQNLLRVSGIYGKNLPKMDLIGLSDPFLEIKIGSVTHTTSVKWNTSSPKWSEVFEFNADSNDLVMLKLSDKDLLSSQIMFDDQSFPVKDLKEGKNEVTYKLSNGGILSMRIDLVTSTKDQEEGIFLPTDPAWTLAKMFVGNSLVIHHEMVTHNLCCHSVMEAVSIAMHHTLYKNHPVRKLLEPHVYYTETVNILARKTLLKDDGSGLVSVLFSVGPDGYKVNDHWFKKFDLKQHAFTEGLKRRNIQIPGYFYAEDGQKVWNAIEKYVKNILKFHYPKDEDYLMDAELQAFGSKLEEFKILKKEPLEPLPGKRPTTGKDTPPSGRGTPTGSGRNSPVDDIVFKPKSDKKKRKSFGFLESVPESDLFESLREEGKQQEKEAPPKGMSLYSLEDITFLLTTLIFNGTSQHTALHYSQLDMMAFAPALPTILNAPPPLYGDKSFGIVKDGVNLSGEQQAMLTKWLPTLGQSIMVNATFNPVTKPQDLVPLISDKWNLFHRSPCKDYFNDFQRDLQGIANHIKQRDYYTYQSRINQSINF